MKRLMLIMCCLVFMLLVLPHLSEAIETHRDDTLGFEISYPPQWEPVNSPDEMKFLIRNMVQGEIGSLSVNKNPFIKWPLSEIKTDTDYGKLTRGIRSRFPDAELLESGDTYLGSFPAYYGIYSYSIKNLDFIIKIIAFQIICPKKDGVYLINFETLEDSYHKTLKQFHSIMASFNFR